VIACMQAGQLGVGHYDNANAPQAIITLAGKKTLPVSCGRRHTVAVTDRAEVFSWGTGTNGELGHGDKVNL
jgi:alpha-tubulin suppressor-like RCC1 family protein